MSYDNDDELRADYENYQNYHDAMLKILYKNSYDEMVFSFKPLKYEYWFTDDCLSPFMFNGIYEDPVLINLNSKSKDFKAIYFYSPALLYPDPTKIYDSIESWMETIIQCYKNQIYHIDDEGFLTVDSKAEDELSRKLNPNSEYWFDPCTTW